MDPINQMWMQGSPPVFLNNEANPVSRTLDGLSCAIRSCCDQAEQMFGDMAKSSGADSNANSPGPTPTSQAVTANENELCGRNLVLSSKTLLDQHVAVSGKIKKHGLSLMVAAMSAFLVNQGGDEQQSSSAEGGSDMSGGFSDEQVKNLLMACDIIIKHPLLLHSPGPIYHMATNAAIMLCHMLNGLSDRKRSGDTGSASANKMDGIIFDEALDTFMATRKLLNIHRKSLPVKLRCHGIPRPGGIGPFKEPNSGPFVDMGDTLMCLCRGCQVFVLMGCSPCVAAERAAKAASAESEDQHDPWAEADSEIQQFGDTDDMNLNDDNLLEILSRIVQN
jgi:hypothetical protein